MPPLRDILRSQYHAALAHLQQAIDLCPRNLWTHAGQNQMPFWRVAYHTLYFTHLYLQHNDHEFRPRDFHETDIQYLDGYPSPPDIEDLCEHPHRPPQTGEPYTREQLQDYWTFCDPLVDQQLNTMDLDRPDSGFSWYKLSKLEHQFINIRHIQHHSAQLADRLREHANIGVNWVSAGASVRNASES
ncbi:MAG: hypothetical protein ACR2IE_01010 [Candidatus Sumerlaeaceae bacterium]